MVDFEELEETVTEFERFSARAYERTEGVDYKDAYEVFLERHPPAVRGELHKVLYDEFVFLFERSWIASRVKESQGEVTDVPGLRRLVFDRDELDAIEQRVPEEYSRKIGH